MPHATAHAIPTLETCFHCGEPCQEEALQAHDHTFCCSGCQTVYEVLNANDLGAYYTWQQQPGTSQQKVRASHFGYLDEPEIASGLYTFHEQGLAQIRFYLPAIHCSSCIWLLEHLQRLHSGVQRSQVNFVKKEALITFRPEVLSLRALAELLSRIGYTPEINLASGQDAGETGKRESRKRALQLGVAGFCFGNIMLLSLPEYIDGTLGVDESFARFFGYLNLLLALPVLLFSSRDYLHSAWQAMVQRRISLDIPIALGIVVLFGRSTWEILTQSGIGYMDSLAGLVFFLLLGRWFQAKTYQALSFERDYRSYFPMAVTVKVGHEEFSLPLKDLKQGDTLFVRHGEIIPADARLESSEAQIDYSFITGESEPIRKQQGDTILAGGRQLGPAILLRVEKPVSQSELTQLWNDQGTASAGQVGLPTLMDRVSRYFTGAILTIALLAGTLWAWVDAQQVAPVVTAILIVACPCALALTLPFAYGHALRWLGRWGLYLKNAQVVERLASLTHLVFDKTGTITHAEDYRFVWEGTTGDPLSDRIGSYVRAVTRQSSHPLSRALYKGLSPGQPCPTLEAYREIPGRGVQATVNGQQVRLGSEAFVNQQITGASDTRVFLAVEGQVLGSFCFRVSYREGYQGLLQRLGRQFTLFLLSGDRNQEQAQLAPYFKTLAFQQSPTHKRDYLRRLRQSGEKAGMVGDGLNDAGALQEAHVGISVAEDVHAFAPACSAILSADRLPQLDSMLRFARQTRRVVIAAMGISFLYNLVGLSFAVLGLLTPLVAAILMPLSSITTVGFITVTINALAKKRSLDGRA